MKDQFLKFVVRILAALTSVALILIWASAASGDPASTIILGITWGALYLSAATTAASFLLQRMFTPKPSPVVQGRMQGALQLQDSQYGVMLTEIYGADPASAGSFWLASTVYALNALVKPNASNQHYYSCTTAGTSGTTEPVWPITSGGTVTDGTAVFTEQGDAGGGIRLAGNIIWTSGIRKTVTTTPAAGGSGGVFGKGAPKSPPTQTINYDMDLAIMIGRGPLNVKRIWANTDLIYDTISTTATGFINPGIGPNPPNDPFYPGDPSLVDDFQRKRYNMYPTGDGNGVITGSIPAGNYANIRIYPGNQLQLQDTLIQGVVDAAQGAGSTPAYRGRCYVVLEKFNISKYSSVPNFTFLVEHQTFKTMDTILADRCTRVGLVSTDYDFTGLSGVAVRGIVISQRQAPRTEIEYLARINAADFTEGDGKLVGKLITGLTSVVTINEQDLGAIDGDHTRQGNDVAPPQIQARLLDDAQLPREINVKYFDPAMDHAVNTHRGVRQVTNAQRVETIELPICMTASDAEKFVNRDLYQRHLEREAYTITLGWKFAYIKPLDVITINRATAGFTDVVKVVQKSGVVPGVQTFTGVAYDASLYTQPAKAGPTPFVGGSTNYPAQSVATLLDTPLLRDADNQPGWYAAMTKRDLVNAYNGTALYRTRDGGNTWEQVAFTDTPATMGRATTALATTADPTVWDRNSQITVDLYYGALATITEAQALQGMNAAVVGDEVICFTNAVKVGGFANRWTVGGNTGGVGGMLRGRKASDGRSEARRTVTWTNLHGVSVSGVDNSLTKTAAGDGDAMATSVEQLSGDGSIEWTINSITSGMEMHGLANAADNTTAGATVLYGMMRATTSGQPTLLRIIEGGPVVFTWGTALTAGARLKISRLANVVTYYVNNALIYTSTVQSDGSPLYTVGWLYHNGDITYTHTVDYFPASALVHTLNERFVLLDNAVKFVPSSIDEVYVPRRFKAVSVGQSINDAAEINFTWTGKSVRPPAPSSITGTRDTLGNLLIEWLRRSRIGQDLRARSDVPLGEEEPKYEIEFINQSNGNIVRTVRVGAGYSGTVTWGDRGQGASAKSGRGIARLTMSNDGTLSAVADGTTTNIVWVRSAQTFSDLTYFEFTVDASGFVPDVGIELVRPLNTQPDMTVFRNTWMWGFNGFIGGTLQNPVNTTALDENSIGINTSFVAGDRLGIELRNGAVYFWKNRINETSVPIAKDQNPIDPNAQYRILCSWGQTNATTGIKTPQLTVRGNAYSYRAADQVQDFGSIQSPATGVKIRLYAVSATVGRGPYAEVIL